MKKHVIQQIIKKQGGNYRVVFRGGKSIFWPCEYAQGLTIGTVVREHKHKNGKTVAFSWDDKIRFVSPQPTYMEEAFDFIEKFRLWDRVRFNNAVMGAAKFVWEPLILPDTKNFAQNLVLFGLQRKYSNSR